MKTRLHRTVRHALLVEPPELELLWQRLAEEYGTLTLTAKCADDTTLEVAALAELLAFENLTYRRVLRVEFQARNSHDDRASIEIGMSATSFHNAELTINSSSDGKSLALMNRLVALLREMRPSHSFAARFNFGYALWLACVAYGLWVTLRRAAGIDPGKTPALSVIDAVNLAILTAAVLGALVWAIGKVQFWLAPRVFFLIGKQRSIWDGRLKWRERLLFGFGLGVLTSVVATYLQASTP